MPNGTLKNSVYLLSSPINNKGLFADTVFSTGPAVNCYWMMQLSKSMHVKAVLVFGAL
jgi:hypothetical protein